MRAHPRRGSFRGLRKVRRAPPEEGFSKGRKIRFLRFSFWGLIGREQLEMEKGGRF